MTRHGEPVLARRFRAHLTRTGHVPDAGPLVVACSGGLDSTVLLHLLRFGARLAPERLVVAHYDHRLRGDSPDDARWVMGLARAWRVEAETAAAMEPPAGEAAARDLRYDFLERVRARRGARAILTAHHADDQAETVLFRALRGTGVRGLRGIPARAGWRVRPLLPFGREALEDYAAAVGLTWRTDSTNRELDRARNVLRHVILPRVESDVAPGARRALVRLARLAGRAEAAWEGAERALLEGVLEEEEGGRIVLARPALLAYDPAVRARVLRACARRLGVELSEAGTRVAMEFTSRGGSGRGIPLPDRLRLGRSFDRLELARSAGASGEIVDAPLLVPGIEGGVGEAGIGGRRIRVVWATGEAPVAARLEAFDPHTLRFPLRLRAWSPGDRMRLGYGTKKVVKLLAEARMPREERHRVAVLVDRDGRVLWVPGLARGVDAVPVPGDGWFYIGVEDAHSA